MPHDLPIESVLAIGTALLRERAVRSPLVELNYAFPPEQLEVPQQMSECSHGVVARVVATNGCPNRASLSERCGDEKSVDCSKPDLDGSCGKHSWYIRGH